MLCYFVCDRTQEISPINDMWFEPYNSTNVHAIPLRLTEHGSWMRTALQILLRLFSRLQQHELLFVAKEWNSLVYWLSSIHQVTTSFRRTMIENFNSISNRKNSFVTFADIIYNHWLFTVHGSVLNFVCQ